MLPSRLFLIFALAVLFLQIPHLSLAQESDASRLLSEKQVLLSAEQVSHDRDLGIITASGKVELSHQGKTLLADSVSYNLKQDIIAASGNVVMSDPEGNVTFVEYFELSGDMKNGFARDILLVLSDKSRLAALQGRRIGGTISELDHAIYSPCEPCKDDPKKPLVWQIKAKEVVHDQEKKQIEYHHARLEMFGVPVAYTPYLSHADPSVKRESGLLFPNFRYNDALGARVDTPYYHVFSPAEDITLTPTVMSQENPLLSVEHRKRYKSGETLTEFSAIQDKNGDARGHINAKGRFDLNETWRTGYQLQRSSDDTYLKRYSFPRERSWLTTRPYVEGFGRKSYALAEAFSFQSLRLEDDPAKSPLVAPNLLYNYVGEPGSYGGYWNFDASALSLTRDIGSDTHRVATRTAWTLPYTTSTGEIYTLDASLRADGYYTQDSNNVSSASTGRLQPEVSLGWRYPFQRYGQSGNEILEPIIVGILSPRGGNPERLPNEDSRSLQFDDTNLFGNNRFTGFDRIESGPRVAYGGRWAYYPRNYGRIETLFGQSYRLHRDALLSGDTGLEDNFSDYVGRVSASPNNRLNMIYRFQADKNDLTLRRQELGLYAGAPALYTTIDYLFFDKRRDQSEFGDRHQISTGIGSYLTRYWRINGSALHDLTDNGGPLTYVGQLIYEDECLMMETRAERNFTYDRDVPDGFGILLRLGFKNLGYVPLNVF